MSWIPEFKFGVWNAWLPMLIYPLSTPLILAIDRLAGTGDLLQKMGGAYTIEEAKKLNAIYTGVLAVLLLYSIFLPLDLGTAWFYAGLIIYLLGLAMFFAALLAAARTPLGHVFTRGIYRYSRHPGYLSMLLMYIGVGVASASWLFLLLAAVLVYLQFSSVKIEEQETLIKFGDEYRDYIKVTPRWIGLPKSG